MLIFYDDYLKLSIILQIYILNIEYLINSFLLPILGWPDGVEGVVAVDDDVVDRRPRPANKCTQSRPLTPAPNSLPLLSPSELIRELVEFGVPTVGGFSILYLRNSTK